MFTASRKSAPTRKPVYVLGTGLSSDGSACLLKDGKICVAIEKERITRLKRDGGNDNEAIQYCLDAEGISFKDISLIVQNDNFSNLDRGHQSYHGKERIIPEGANVITVSHHLAHAYSVIGTAPFDEMAILIVDGCGSSMDDCHDLEGAKIPMPLPDDDSQHLYFEKDSYYLFKDGQLKPALKDFSPFGYFLKGYTMCPQSTKHSIGGVYSAAGRYIFQGMEDIGKLMELAAYGNPGIYRDEIFELKDGRVFVNYDWMDKFDMPRVTYDDLFKHFQYYADIAYWVQQELEKSLLYLLKSRHHFLPHENLGFAGGVVLNAAANSQIQTHSPFSQFYFHPAAADNGLAIGCAYYGWMEILKRERVPHNQSPFFGRRYSQSETEKALDKQKDSIKSTRSEDTLTIVSNALCEGKIVGWFEGGAEFGSQALGHRSILADPRNPEAGKILNDKIKFREGFRPFSPAVLKEHMAKYFECDTESPFKLITAPIREQWRDRIPAVTNTDNTSRIQSVTREHTPAFYDLINTFGEKTGVYMLLNTSLNSKNTPMIETPEQALEFFLQGTLDLLVIDGHIIEKNDSVATSFSNNMHIAWPEADAPIPPGKFSK